MDYSDNAAILNMAKITVFRFCITHLIFLSRLDIFSYFFLYILFIYFDFPILYISTKEPD